MGGNGTKQVITSSANDPTTTIVSSGTIHPRPRIVENSLVIWIDANNNQSNKDYQNILTCLHNVVNIVHTFTQPDQCIQFLNEIKTEKVFVITSGSFGQHFVPDIHALSQLDAIYIFCRNKSYHERWAKVWFKIKGVHTNIKPICQALHLAVKQCNQDSMPVSFLTLGENLNQLKSSFMYTQLFKEILLEMVHDDKSIKDLVIYCRQFYTENLTQLTILDEFENNYRSTLAIWWYTRECFTYQMLNRAVRTLDSDTIINMGVFIRDLHQQIHELYQKQASDYRGKSLTVYRGQVLSKANFEKLVEAKGGLMSFNNFLSTSNQRKPSLRFATSASTKTDMVGILFVITIDPFVSGTPFASIKNVSYYKTEEEILFIK
jgi:hypothetical protein